MKTKKSFPLRINIELLEKLKVISSDNSRSINKEIEFIIKKYIKNMKTIKKINNLIY